MRGWLAVIGLLGLVLPQAQGAEGGPSPPPAAVPDSRAVMTGEQVVQILDETVDWYRTLGIQQQAATQPSDLLILYANRQTADKVVALAFEIARANAELISSEAGAMKAREEESSSQSVNKLGKQLDTQRAAIQADIESVRNRLAAAPKETKSDLQTRLAVLQGELEMINARRNLLAKMSRFAAESDSEGFGANALKVHIDAIAATIPAASKDAAAPAPSTTAASSPSANASSMTLTQFGIWDLAATVFRLSSKARTIETIDQRTADLQQVFANIRSAPAQQLQALSSRGDALAAQADADGANLRGVRDQYDTLAWLYDQTSAIVIPLSRAGVLLDQYRDNLTNWREATQRQYREALRALALRLTLFAGLLALIFAAAELWRRAVFRYVQDTRRRSRLLFVRKIVLWALVVIVVASTLATELGSLATFAGLITAGLAVAMQSVLVSVVGYFFLIGKYGIRVGDRVQIGNVTGEVIDLGLVRMHLMELSGQGSLTPTGRVVAFANSIIFQASGGLFKQIPGINLAWHEMTVSLPPGSDYTKLKDKLMEAVSNVLADYREDIMRQTQEIQRTATSGVATGDAQPQVQLRFSVAGVDAIVRYPVQLQHAAEIDERVSRELLNVVSAHETSAAHAT